MSWIRARFGVSAEVPLAYNRSFHVLWSHFTGLTSLVSDCGILYSHASSMFHVIEFCLYLHSVTGVHFTLYSQAEHHDLNNTFFPILFEERGTRTTTHRDRHRQIRPSSSIEGYKTLVRASNPLARYFKKEESPRTANPFQITNKPTTVAQMCILLYRCSMTE
jgi:hypothetical protein